MSAVLRKGPRGFTLLEAMLSSAMAIVVLAGAVGVSAQLQRRSVFEEQVMQAQVGGRAVKDVMAADLARAGAGMGNSRLRFNDANIIRLGINVLNEPDLSVAQPVGAAIFQPDTNRPFALPQGVYAGMASDALQLWWGDVDGAVMLSGCGGGAGPKVTVGNSLNFCAPASTVYPDGFLGGQVMVLNPTVGEGCHVEPQTDTGNGFNANPGRGGGGGPSGHACSNGMAGMWSTPGWMAMRTRGSSWRVNWQGGQPVLEYDSPDTAAVVWEEVSRDVERLKVRQGVRPVVGAPLRWYPDAGAGRPAISDCTLAQLQPGGVCEVTWLNPAPTTLNELRAALQAQVQELEVTLTMRTRRQDIDQNFGTTLPDQGDGWPNDGFKRRIYSFRVVPRNFLP